ncbi:MAG: DUF1194 domain-containing protein [Tepidamorphaceae bacterium]
MSARWKAVLIVLLSLVLLPAPQAAAQTPSGPVELELVLAVDTSASVDPPEYALQMAGIADAFRDRDVIAAIEAYGGAGIAVCVVHWSTDAALVVGWAHVRDRHDALLLADEIERAPRAAIGVTTAIGSALSQARSLIANNGITARRAAVDVSGDGPNNSGFPLWRERNRSVESGITVNGLAILDDDPTLDAYYANHVIAGPDSFLIIASTFEDFARAFRIKLLREIRVLVSDSGEEPAGETVAVRSEGMRSLN